MNKIKFVQTRNIRGIKSLTITFPVLGKRLKWMQKLCLWTLNKLGARIEQTTTEYQEQITEIDVDQFINKQQVLDQMNEALSHRITPRTLLVGRANFNRIMQIELDYLPITFGAQVACSDGRNRRFLGLDIHIVPWMEGFIILDKKLEELDYENK